MSAILDAIKKSQNVRESDKQASRPEMQYNDSQNNSKRYLLMSLLVIIILTVLVVNWVRNSQGILTQTYSFKYIQPSFEPELQINAISYSGDPKKRLAMIDGKVYKQGDIVQNNWQIFLIGKEFVTVLKDNTKVTLRLVDER